MSHSEKDFYLGRLVDPTSAETTDEPLHYDPDDLTTHAVVVGMTGSGKTGLGLDLLEEAALKGLPALMLDPKGDITNLLLQFPELRPDDFEPWVDAREAQRQGKTTAELAQATAAMWKTGLESWGIQQERIKALLERTGFAIYTPGSDAGIPVSIVASLKAPDLSWQEHREMLREKVSSTVTALLGLIGLSDIDPLKSREHILLASIFEHAWSQDQDLDLGPLLMQIQTPPFEKLGFFDVETFFPQKDRFELAMQLNNILASPSFQTWIEGEPLDIGRMLHGSDGRPRHSIFYLAHLSDRERMFFVTLFYSAVDAWMRTQSGTASLRALVYFDEIFGYLPPVKNPPSKEPMLRLLKQARAFGVGMVLSTQNPVDIDYKALSNAGTWMIGRLSTEQDKDRLLEGLSSASGAGLDRRQYDNLISSLGKRVFLMRNVHDSEPKLFQTRWAQSFLAGPLTRHQIPSLTQKQIPALNELVQTQQFRQTEESGTEVPDRARPGTQEHADLPGTTTKPALPTSVAEYFLPATLSDAEAAARDRRVPESARRVGLLYRPALVAQAEIQYRRSKYNLDTTVARTRLLAKPDRRGQIRWDDHPDVVLNAGDLPRQALPEARFESLASPLGDDKVLRAVEDDFEDWVYRTGEIQVRANEELKLYAGPDVTETDFLERCRQAAEEEVRAEGQKVADSFERKMDRVEEKLAREQRELAEDEAELAQRRQEGWMTHAGNLLSLFTKKRPRLSTSMTKHRMTSKAAADVEESVQAIADYERQLAELRQEAEDALHEVQQRWQDIAREVTSLPVTPYKKDIHLTLFGVAWVPYYLFEDPSSDGRLVEVMAFPEA